MRTACVQHLMNSRAGDRNADCMAHEPGSRVAEQSEVYIVHVTVNTYADIVHTSGQRTMSPDPLYCRCASWAADI